MADENFKNQFKKGTTALIILTFLQERDMYGYEIIQKMIKRSNGSYFIPEGSLYPALYKLIEQGYISGDKIQVGKRLTRVYYHLEPTGAEFLKQMTEEYHAVQRDVELILNKSGENATDED